MGFLDSLLGKTKLPESKTDKLFAISTAAITLEANLGLKPDGSAAICFKPMESSRYDAARSEIEDLLKISSRRPAPSILHRRMSMATYGWFLRIKTSRIL